MGARLPQRIGRRAKARTRFGWAKAERETVALAVVAVGGAGVVVVDQFGRLLRRRAQERESEEALIEAAPAAAADTVGVAVRGYAEAPRSETVLFNLLAGFLGSFALVRLSTWGISDRWGPFRNVSVRGRHIHHFVPGILIAFASGTAALLTENDDLERPPGDADGRRHRPDLRRGRPAARPARRLLDPRGPAQRPAQPRRHRHPQHRHPHPADAAPGRAPAGGGGLDSAGRNRSAQFFPRHLQSSAAMRRRAGLWFAWTPTRLLPPPWGLN